MVEDEAEQAISEADLRARERLLDDRHPSVLISREGGGQSLLIIKSLPSARVDFSGTPLRNGLAIRVPRSLEPALSSLAAAMLENPAALAGAIDGMIYQNAESKRYGFRVDFDRLRRFVDQERWEGKPSTPTDSASQPLFGNYEVRFLHEELAATLRASNCQVGSKCRCWSPATRRRPHSGTAASGGA
jgi:hypothetical protein